MTGTERFTAMQIGGRWGVHDDLKSAFAPFWEGGPWSAEERATTCAGRLNEGTDKPTGMIWE